MSGKRNKKMRKLLRHEILMSRDPRAVRQFPAEQVAAVESKPVQPPLSPEEQELTRLYKTFATTVWRMRNVIIDTETNEPKESLDERAVSRMAKYLESLDGALEDARVQVKGDYAGHPYDEGDAVKVITFEDRKDLSRDEYVETLLPTVRWMDKDGKSRLLQQAEVVVGKASAGINDTAN